MTAIDKNYLLLQFKDRIYSKNGTEFQSFFEEIIVRVYPTFRKIPSGGGDGGNDGWIKESGSYYQVYAPNTPAIKDSEAANKLKRDFIKLQSNWNNISEVKEYYFVFNDKYFGSNKTAEVISELEKENPKIKFDTLLSNGLEKLFFKLEESDILNLGFNIDSRQAIDHAYKYLGTVEVELDREIANAAMRMIEGSREIITNLKDEKLALEHEILECRCLQKLERIDEAKVKYENISKRFPYDPRAFLYLAEIYLNENKNYENRDLLDKAKAIDKDNWLLELEELVRQIHLNEKIEIGNIDESKFPTDPRLRANFYRIYAILLRNSGEEIISDNFIEKALHLNPIRFSTYIAKLSLLEIKLHSSQESSRNSISKELLKESLKIETKFIKFGDIGPRNKAILNMRKLHAHLIQENYSEFEVISQETFKFVLNCYLDKGVEQILTELLSFVQVSNNYLIHLQEYIKNSKREISEELIRVLIIQFIVNNNLYTSGKKFFTEINSQKYLVFINNLESNCYENVIAFLTDNTLFAIKIANTLKNQPHIRIKIIESLPEDIDIQKDKLLLLLNLDEKNFKKAFDILKRVDLQNLNYFECKPILKIIQEKKAWDFEVIVLEKLLEKERNENEIFIVKSQLFNALFNLKKYSEVIRIGEMLLKLDSEKNILSPDNKIALLQNTIVACINRGKIDKNAYIKAKDILEEHQIIQTSFEFKADIEAEVYLKNHDPEKALQAVIEGIKIKKVLTPEEYAKLFFVLCLKIGNLVSINTDSLDRIEENTFLKFKDNDQWFFIGDGNELDAIKITRTNDKYSSLIKKKCDEKVIFKYKYSSESSEEVIERIFSYEKYISWQVINKFQKLSKDGLLEGVQMVEIPKTGETVDPKYLINYFEDLKKNSEPFFNIYCNNNVPLALLAVSEGGLVNAIGKIQLENKGFINFSAGTTDEFEKQKEIAKKVLINEEQFYIDGTSAFILAEIGLLKKIFVHIPNIKIPHSVITMMADISERFKYSPGQIGNIGYFQGKITISSINIDKRDLIQSNFLESIKLFESVPKNIRVITSANKDECFSEQNVPAELCDACILAQKENIPILTEDYLYLNFNEIETNKKAPKYFSSLSIIRVLYEMRKISFEDYINFFDYLSSRRFRFLSLNSFDIEKAVFGDTKIKLLNTSNIRKLNFHLTLSEEYGVPFQKSFLVVGIFFIKIIIDIEITTEIIDRIFLETLETFPTKLNKKELGQLLLKICADIINKKANLFPYAINILIAERLNRLLELTEIFESEKKLWVPDL